MKLNIPISCCFENLVAQKIRGSDAIFVPPAPIKERVKLLKNRWIKLSRGIRSGNCFPKNKKINKANTKIIE